MEWRWQSFAELTTHDLYDILALRQRVFVVEQQCAYCDADGFDQGALHLTARRGDRVVAAYLRLLLPGTRFPEPSIGRLLVGREMRGRGAAGEAMRRAVARCDTLFPGEAVKISAQVYLVEFYHKFGFAVCSDFYDEDGIEHVDMVRR